MTVLLTILTFPQTLICLIVSFLNRNKIIKRKIYTVHGIDILLFSTKDTPFSNMGLGFCGFYLDRCPEDAPEELGHCVQSFYLSWLFIPAWLLSFGLMDKWAVKIGNKLCES